FNRLRRSSWNDRRFAELNSGVADFLMQNGCQPGRNLLRRRCEVRVSKQRFYVGVGDPLVDDGLVTCQECRPASRGGKTDPRESWFVVWKVAHRSCASLQRTKVRFDPDSLTGNRSFDRIGWKQSRRNFQLRLWIRIDLEMETLQRNKIIHRNIVHS